MLNRLSNYLILLSTIFALAACGFGFSYSDLDTYIEQVKQKPAGSIEELPTFTVYEPFVYSASGERSPFDQPVVIEQRIIAKANSNVKPDENRIKEYLEGFALSELQMVGTLDWGGTLYALVQDNSGEIHRVRNGNFLGKNHGKIISTTNISVELIEIVSNGLDGWIERPRILALSEQDQ